MDWLQIALFSSPAVAVLTLLAYALSGQAPVDHDEHSQSHEPVVKPPVFVRHEPPRFTLSLKYKLPAWTSSFEPDWTRRGFGEDYLRFLAGYMCGTHDSRMIGFGMEVPDNIIVASLTQPEIIPALFGLDRLTVIVQEGAVVEFPDGLGDSSVLYMEDYRIETNLQTLFASPGEPDLPDQSGSRLSRVPLPTGFAARCDDCTGRGRAGSRRGDRREIPDGTMLATTDEYSRFVRGYCARGGKIAFVRSYPCREILVARTDLELPPLYGTSALQIIVPKGVDVSFPAGIGHSKLFLMDGFRVEGGGGVEIFSDLKL